MAYEPVTLEHLLRHQDWALRVARRLVHEESEAEDLLQRTWMAALRRPPQREAGARAWLRKVLLNLARERHRRREARDRHERASAAAAPADSPDAPDTLEQLTREEMNALLGKELLALKEPYRAVVLGRYFDDLSSAEIARRLGIPAGTVRWRLKVGLDLLRSELDRRSNGDRSRWVSALALLVPRGAAPDADDLDGPEPEQPLADEAGPAAPVATGTLVVAGWTGLAAVGLLGAVLVLRDGSRPVADAPAVATAATADRAGTARAEGTLAPPGRTAPERAPEPPRADTPDARSGIEVHVLDATGAPVADARVLVAGVAGTAERARTDAEGRAFLARDPADVGALGLAATRGRLSLRALAPGRAASPLVHAARPLERAEPVVLVTGGPEIVRSGRVVDADGEPVPDACVAWVHPYSRLAHADGGDFASPAYLATTSGPDGRYELANLADEPGHLYVLAPGFAARFSDLGPPAATDEEIVLTRGGRLTGTVRRADGTPAAGASVGLEPLFKSSEWATGLPGYDQTWRGFGEATRTDATGSFELANVAPGGRHLWAQLASEGLVADAALLVDEGGELREDVVLEPRTGFRLRLVDETGRPLAGWTAHVRRRIEGGEWWIRRRESDADGRVRIDDAPAAEALVDIYDPTGAGGSWLACKLAPQEAEQELVIETRASCSAAGRLLDATGAPELGGTLAFHSLRTAQEVAVERAEDGEFEHRLPPGPYVLVLKLETSATKLARVVLEPGERAELGVLATPALGSLRVEAPPAADAAASLALFAALDPDRPDRFQPVGRVTLTAERALAVFPGRYRVVASTGAGAARESFVEVAPNLETRLDPWR